MAKQFIELVTIALFNLPAGFYSVLFLVVVSWWGYLSPCLGNLPRATVTCPLSLFCFRFSALPVELVHTVSSASQIFFELNLCPDCEKDGLPSHLLLLSSFWGGTVCYLLLNCPAIKHLPGLPNFVYFYFCLWRLLAWSTLPTLPQLPSPSVVSCLEL